MKKRHPQNPPKPKQFSVTPFSTLKGMVTAAPHVKPPSPPPPPVAEETDDDLDLFLRAVSDVRPIRSEVSPAPKNEGAAAPPQPRARRFEEEDSALFLQALEGMETLFTEEADDDSEPLRLISVSRMKLLKQGEIRIRLELDLHGLTRDEALESLGQFITGAWRRAMKAVLVITGKGNNSPGEPVLQAAVAGWLQDKGKKMVVEFLPAPRQMGGSGAFVVFLRDPDAEKP